MKIILGIIIGIGLTFGTFSFASNAVKLVMVPESIDGYKTTELLKYVVTLKKVDEAKVEVKKEVKVIPIKTNTKFKKSISA
jgi:hypothetical protein